MMSPHLIAEPSARSTFRIPYDTRPFHVLLGPGEEIVMAGSIHLMNASLSSIDARVRFFLQGGWFLEIGQSEGPIQFSDFVNRGVQIYITEEGIKQSDPLSEK